MNSGGIVIVGGGLAACAAAIEAAKYGLPVTLIDKGVPGRSGSSCTAGGGFSFAQAGPPPDTDSAAQQRHYADTLRAGEGLNDPRLVQRLVEEAPLCVPELERYGLRFPHGPGGGIEPGRAPAHSEARTASPQDGGPALMDALRRELLHRRVRTIERTMVVRLAMRDGQIAGLYALPLDGGDAFLIRCASVVLAAGSATHLYPFASANYHTTGDAFALAWEAGAALANLEFNEFTLIPKVGRAVIATPGISSMMASGSHLLNGLGERFMPRYDPERAETTTRARLVQAAVLETRAGRGPVWNDSMAIPGEVRARLAVEDWEILGKLQGAGLRWPEEPFEWVPASHLCLGGVVIGEQGDTAAPGLFACGEAATGIHGANRLSGNALSECLVFGIRAGRAAALHALAAGDLPVDAEDATRSMAELAAATATGGPDPAEWQHEVRAAAWEGIGVVRSETGLQQILERLSVLAEVKPACTFSPRPDSYPRNTQSDHDGAVDRACRVDSHGEPGPASERRLPGDRCKLAEVDRIAKRRGIVQHYH